MRRAIHSRFITPPTKSSAIKAHDAGHRNLDGASATFPLAHAKYHLRTVNLTTMPSHQRAVACRNVGDRECFKWAVQRNVRPWKKDSRP